MRKNGFLAAVAAVIFLGLGAYGAAYISRIDDDTYETVCLERVSVCDSAELYGIVVREEKVLDDRGFFVLAEEGERIPGNSIIAAKDAQLDAALDYKDALREAEKISQCKDLRVSETISRNKAVKQAVLSAAYSAAQKDGAGLSAAGTSLDYLLSGALPEQTEIAVKPEENVLLSPCGGICSEYLDGFEHLSFEDVDGISPGELEKLLRRQSSGEKSGLRFVSGDTWFFAATVSGEDAEKLKAGGEFSLLPDNMTEAVPVSCVSLEKAGKKYAAVLKCRSRLNEALYLRKENAELVFAQIEGLKVPRKALVECEDGPYVYVKEYAETKKTAVKIIYEAEDWVLVSPNETDSVRQGMEILLGVNDERGIKQ